MVNHCCDGCGSYPAILIPEQFRHSCRAFAPNLALPAIRQPARLPVLAPRDRRGAAAAVRDAMGGETISSNGEHGTKEAEALAAALNHSAERVQTLWFSFLTFTLYLAVATGTTTHRMLFLDRQDVLWLDSIIRR